jgi:dipeptidyl aminopeptidase/acylaminoacyl peptidase
VDALVAEGYIDVERVGAMGWSQGGYISMFISTYSDRFKAVSAGAGIANWMTYYVNTDVHPFTRQYLEATPWEEKEIYAQTSPMTYIQQAQTPTLIQHGKADARVPVPNAFELAARIASQLKGQPVSKVVFYSDDLKKDPAAHTALGCLHVAAALHGDLAITHETIKYK